ncbi:MAG: PEGA domain-containing protein [Polyangiaceae bacterium]
MHFSRILLIGSVLLLSPPLRAQGAESAPMESESPAVTRARALFVEGTELAEKMRWGEAREKFEASLALHAHRGTLYNVGVCERALGHFTRARGAFQDALRDDRLDADMRREATQFLKELEAVIARVELELIPAGALLSVDGRPLQRVVAGTRDPGPSTHAPSPGTRDPGAGTRDPGTRDPGTRFVAGTRDPGPGQPAPRGKFVIELDPGHHVLLIARRGYRDVVRPIDVAPASSTSLTLSLAKLPGKLLIDANEKDAVVRVNDLDVGIAPVRLSRPAGRYRVVVRKPGFTEYATEATLSAGERVELDARLSKEPVLLTERWWFWTGIGVALVGIGVGTYAATRPDPERPPVSQGTLGWSVPVP